MKVSSLAKRIVNLRVKHNISQSVLAERAGVSPAAISLLEKGDREPTLKTAIALCDALGISLDVFAGRKEYPNTEYTLRIEIIKLQQILNQISNLTTQIKK